MGCTHSSLAGGPNTFTDIDATPSQPLTWRPKGKTPDPIESSLSAEAYTHTSPVMRRDERGFGDQGIGKSPEVKIEREGGSGVLGEYRGEDRDEEGGWDGDDDDAAAAAAAAAKRREAKSRGDSSAVPFPVMSGKVRPTKEEYEAAQKEENARVKARLEAEMVDPETGKKLGMYQRLQRRKRGVGEERDPVTGRGKYTGMTKEETIEYVRRTRGSGMHSAQKYTFVGTEGGAPWGAY